MENRLKQSAHFFLEPSKFHDSLLLDKMDLIGPQCYDIQIIGIMRHKDGLTLSQTSPGFYLSAVEVF